MTRSPNEKDLPKEAREQASGAPAAVDLQVPALKEQVISALEAMGVEWCELASAPTAPMAILRMAGAGPSELEPLVPVVSFWQRNRQRGYNNPFSDRRVRNILSANPGLEDEVLRATMQQIQHASPTRLADILAPGTAIETETYYCSDQKREALARLELFSEAHGLPNHVFSSLELALDEMFTNAVYNAPVDEGRRLFSTSSRRTAVESALPVAVQFGADDRYVGIGVRDEYGSLWPDEFLDGLARCHSHEKAAVSDKPGGAGLGLFLLLEHATRMVVNLKPGDFTEVVFVRKIRERRRAFADSAPTLNICVCGEDDMYMRRRSRRIWVDWPVHRGGDTSEAVTKALDVSPHGAFLKASKRIDPEVGSTLDLALAPTPSQPPLSVRATVRWIGHSRTHRCEGFGVQFEREVEEINAYIRQGFAPSSATPASIAS